VSGFPAVEPHPVVEPVETPEVLLQLDGVSMQYGKGETAITALSGVDLQVHAGELVAIMGASGSGKSTLLTIAGGLTTPTSGEVIVEGEWLSTMSAAGVAALRRRTLGFVFQDFNLIPALTALENVTLPLELDGWKRRKARSVGLDALRAVELTDRADRFPDDLSGGPATTGRHCARDRRHPPVDSRG
jgi:putative ABC transport system ATP-binding protein